MKTSCRILMILLATVPAARGQGGLSSGSISVALASQYLFRGQLLGGMSAQASAEGTVGTVAAGIWSNLPMEDPDGFSSEPEVDPYFTASIGLGGRFRLEPGATLYLYPDADAAQGYYRAALEPAVALDAVIGGVRLKPKVSYDFQRRGTTAELGTALAYALPSLGTEIDLFATAGGWLQRDAVRGASPAIKSWGRYWQAGVTIPYQVGLRSRISVGWSVSVGENAFLKQGSAPRVANPRAVRRGIVTLTWQRSL